MPRETRYLWVGNLPEKITEERITDHFQRHGKIQSVRLQAKKDDQEAGAIVAFMDIKSASKAHKSDNNIDGVNLVTEYSEPTATGSAVTRTHEPTIATDLRGQYTQQALNRQSARYPNRNEGLKEDRSYERRDYYNTSSGSSSNRGGAGDYNQYDKQSLSNKYEEDYAAASSAAMGQSQQQAPRGRTKQRFSNALPSSSSTSSSSASSSNNNSRSNQPFPRPTVQSQAKVVTPRTIPQQSSSSTSSSSQHVESQVSYPADRYPDDAYNDRSKRGGHSPARAAGASTAAGSKPSKSKRRPSYSPSRGSRSSSSSSSSRSSSSSSRSGSRSRSSSKTSRMSKDPDHKSKKDVGAGDKNDKKNLGIIIRGLPLRSTDTSLRDGLFHEYKKHGKVTSVHIFGANEDRYAVVSFKKTEDATKAFEASEDKMFFGTKIQVALHEGFAEAEDNEFRPPEAELDEFHPKATRTLFVGNLEKEVTAAQLRDIFKPFGEIVVQDIDIKKQGAVSAYAFVQYGDIASVVRSLRKMDGEHIGANKIKLGFGKSMPTTCVWLDGIAESVNEKFLCRQFSRFGPVTHAVIDKVKGRAMVYFESMEFAQHAVNEMRGRALAGKKIQVDFASRDCQTAFFEKMERTGQLRPGERPDERMGRLYRQQQGLEFEERFEAPVGAVPVGRENRARRGTSGNYENFDQPSNRGTSGRGNFRNNGTGGGRNNANFRGRNRGKGNRSGGNSGGAGQFYDAAYNSQDEFSGRRSGRQFEEYNEEYGFEDDSYEQELRDFGYSQRERRERGSLSPVARDRRREGRSISPFSRTSRQTSSERHYDERYSDRYVERYRDTDSQSGDRDSVRSYPSMRSEARREYRGDRMYDEKYSQSSERYVEESRQSRTVDRQSVRSFSPASSEYSQGRLSPAAQQRRSRSLTPQPKRKTADKYRLSSPQTPPRKDYSNKPTREVSRPTSPVEYDNYKDANFRDGKTKYKDKFAGEPMDMDITIAVKYESDNEKLNKMSWTSAKPGKLLPSDVERTKKSKKHRDSSEEKFDVDSKHHRTDYLDRLVKRSVSGEIQYNTDSIQGDETSSRHKKLDKQRSRSASSSGSRNKHKDSDLDHTDKSEKTKTDRVDVNAKKDKSRHKVTVDETVSTRILPSKMDKHRQLHSSSRHPVDNYPGVDIQIDKVASESESSKIDSDQDSYTERESLRSQSSDFSNLEKRKLQLLNMLQQLEDGGSTSDNDSGTLQDDDGKKGKKTRLEDVFDLDRTPRRRDVIKAELEECELLESTTKSRWREANKLKPLDTAKFKPIDSTQSYRKQMEARRLMEQRQQIKSEVHVTGSTKLDLPNKTPVMDGISKKIVPNHEDENFDSGTEKSPRDLPGDFHVIKRRISKPGDSLDYDHAKSTKSKRSYRSKNSREGSTVGSSSEDEHSSAVNATKSKSDSVNKPDTPISNSNSGSYKFVEPRLVDPRDQLHVDPDIKSPTLQRLDLKELKSPVEIRTDFQTPLEIPSDTKSPRDVRIDRRTANDSKRDSPMFLPLPKFARMSAPLPSPITSPKLHISPKVQSPQASPAFPKLHSPPFSPGSTRPQSPVLSPTVINKPESSSNSKPDEISKVDVVVTKDPIPEPPSDDTKTEAEVKVEPSNKDVDLPPAPGTPKDEVPKKPDLLTITKSPKSPPSPLGSSDSDILSPNSPRRPCLDDRIRALDQMMSMQQQAKAPDTTAAPTIDYREKYRIRKRIDSTSTTTGQNDQTKSEPSDIVKMVLARSSIFDQDSKRLEQINEKYEPKDVSINLNEDTNVVNTASPIVRIPPPTIVMPPSASRFVAPTLAGSSPAHQPFQASSPTVSQSEDQLPPPTLTSQVPIATVTAKEPEISLPTNFTGLSQTVLPKESSSQSSCDSGLSSSQPFPPVAVIIPPKAEEVNSPQLLSPVLKKEEPIKCDTITSVSSTLPVLKKESLVSETTEDIPVFSADSSSVTVSTPSQPTMSTTSPTMSTTPTMSTIPPTMSTIPPTISVNKETVIPEVKKDSVIKREPHVKESKRDNSSTANKSVLGKRKLDEKSSVQRSDSKTSLTKSSSVDNKDLFKPDIVAKTSEPEVKKMKVQPPLTHHQKERKPSESTKSKSQHSSDRKDERDKKHSSKSSDSKSSESNSSSKVADSKPKPVSKETDKPKASSETKEKPHKSHHEKTSRPSSSSTSSTSSSSSLSNQSKDKHRHSAQRDENKDKQKDASKYKDKKDKEKESKDRDVSSSKDKESHSAVKVHEHKTQKSEKDTKQSEKSENPDKTKEDKTSLERESPHKDTSHKTEKSEKKSSQERSERKSSKESSSRSLEKGKSFDRKSKDKERELSADRKPKSKDRRDDDHSHSTSSSDRSKDKHPERSRDRSDQRDKSSKEKSSSDAKTKTKSDRDTKTESSSGSKSHSKESSSKSDKKKPKEEPEKKKPPTETKMDRRELLRIVEEAERAEGIPVYESMYDKVKRRSSKEKDKEQDMFDVRMKLNQLSEKRRKKVMRLSSDESSSENSDDSDSDVVVPRKDQKRDRIGNKSPKKKRVIIESSSSEDEDSSLASEQVDSLREFGSKVLPFKKSPKRSSVLFSDSDDDESETSIVWKKPSVPSSEPLPEPESIKPPKKMEVDEANLSDDDKLHSLKSKTKSKKKNKHKTNREETSGNLSSKNVKQKEKTPKKQSSKDSIRDVIPSIKDSLPVKDTPSVPINDEIHNHEESKNKQKAKNKDKIKKSVSKDISLDLGLHEKTNQDEESSVTKHPKVKSPKHKEKTKKTTSQHQLNEENKEVTTDNNKSEKIKNKSMKHKDKSKKHSAKEGPLDSEDENNKHKDEENEEIKTKDHKVKSVKRKDKTNKHPTKESSLEAHEARDVDSEKPKASKHKDKVKKPRDTSLDTGDDKESRKQKKLNKKKSKEKANLTAAESSTIKPAEEDQPVKPPQKTITMDLKMQSRQLFGSSSSSDSEDGDSLQKFLFNSMPNSTDRKSSDISQHKAEVKENTVESKKLVEDIYDFNSSLSSDKEDSLPAKSIKVESEINVFSFTSEENNKKVDKVKKLSSKSEEGENSKRKLEDKNENVIIDHDEKHKKEKKSKTKELSLHSDIRLEPKKKSPKLKDQDHCVSVEKLFTEIKQLNEDANVSTMKEKPLETNVVLGSDNTCTKPVIAKTKTKKEKSLSKDKEMHKEVQKEISPEIQHENKPKKVKPPKAREGPLFDFSILEKKRPGLNHFQKDPERSAVKESVKPTSVNAVKVNEIASHPKVEESKPNKIIAEPEPLPKPIPEPMKVTPSETTETEQKDKEGGLTMFEEISQDSEIGEENEIIDKKQSESSSNTEKETMKSDVTDDKIAENEKKKDKPFIKQVAVESEDECDKMIIDEDPQPLDKENKALEIEESLPTVEEKSSLVEKKVEESAEKPNRRMFPSEEELKTAVETLQGITAEVEMTAQAEIQSMQMAMMRNEQQVMCYEAALLDNNRNLDQATEAQTSAIKLDTESEPTESRAEVMFEENLADGSRSQFSEEQEAVSSILESTEDKDEDTPFSQLEVNAATAAIESQENEEELMTVLSENKITESSEQLAEPLIAADSITDDSPSVTEEAVSQIVPAEPSREILETPEPPRLPENELPRETPEESSVSKPDVSMCSGHVLPGSETSDSADKEIENTNDVHEDVELNKAPGKEMGDEESSSLVPDPPVVDEDKNESAGTAPESSSPEPQRLVPPLIISTSEHAEFSTSEIEERKEEKRPKRTKSKILARCNDKLEYEDPSAQDNAGMNRIELRERDGSRTPLRGRPGNRSADRKDIEMPERFSSRGRKIIPKERDDELTTLTKKVRRSSESSTGGIPQRTRRATAATPEVEDGRKGKITRRSLGKQMGKVEDQVDDGQVNKMADQDSPETPPTPAVRRSPRTDKSHKEESPEDELEEDSPGQAGRRKGVLRTRRAKINLTIKMAEKEEEPAPKTENDLDSLENKDNDEEIGNLVIDLKSTAGYADMPQAPDASPRGRRRGRPKGKKGADSSSMSPRRPEPVIMNAMSPRSKALETGATSPKASEFSSPIVKLEKLPMVEARLKSEESRKEESGKIKDETRKLGDVVVNSVEHKEEKRTADDTIKAVKTNEVSPQTIQKQSVLTKPSIVMTASDTSAKAPEKDLYAWEDDDDKPMQELTSKRFSRKRIYGQTSPQRSFHRNVEVEPKRFKEDMSEITEPAMNLKVPGPVEMIQKPVVETEKPVTELFPPTPDVNKMKTEAKSPPIMPKAVSSDVKKETEDPDWLKAHLSAEKQQEPVPTIITPASPETLPTPSSLTSSIMATTALTKQSEVDPKMLPWQIHMNEVIEDVAKGNFEWPPEVDNTPPIVQPRKKQRTKSSDQTSPKGTVAQMLSMAHAQQQQKQQQQQQQQLNLLMHATPLPGALLTQQMSLAGAGKSGELVANALATPNEIAHLSKLETPAVSSSGSAPSKPDKSPLGTGTLMKVINNTPTSVTISKVDSLSPVSVSIPLPVANFPPGLAASSPLSPHGQLSPKYMTSKGMTGGQHLQPGVVNISRSSTPHQIQQQAGHPMEMPRPIKEGARRVSEGERRSVENRNSQQQQQQQQQERRNSDEAVTGRGQRGPMIGRPMMSEPQNMAAVSHSGATMQQHQTPAHMSGVHSEGKHPALRSPGGQGSSVIQQLPQAQTQGKTTQGGANPGLQQVGYPVSAYEAAMQRMSPKDRSPAMQISPGIYPPEVKSPQGAGMMPPMTALQNAVHLGVVQSQAYSIGQREASPPGQVIEKVPNPHIRSSGGGQHGEVHAAAGQGEMPVRSEARGGRGQNTLHAHPDQQQLAGMRQASPGALHPSMLQAHPHYMHMSVPYGSVKPSPTHQPSFPSPGGSAQPVSSAQPTPAKSQSQSSNVAQTSELRAVLNQPSKLAQQQKFLQQQQQLAQQMQASSAAHQKDVQAGLQYAQHRMPFTFQEPRGTSQSRAEPKVSTQQPHFEGQFSEARLSQEQQARIGGLPSSAFTPPDPRMNPAEPRPAIPQQFYHGEFRMQPPGLPYPQGSLSMGVPPRVPMDPRMMFTAAPPHPEFVNPQQGAHMMPGMVPQHSQHYLLHQQGAQVERRPPTDRPPSASARPPSRSTPQPAHLQRATPQSPAPPVGHLMGAGGGRQAAGGYPMPGQQRMQDTAAHPDNFMALLTRYPVMWQGILALKNDQATVQMHFVSGGRHLAQLALPPLTPDNSGCLLRIVQRMRLEPTQLEGVSRRMQMEEDYCMLLALPCGTDHIDILNQTKALSTGFIQYLQQKQAAGIVNVPAPGTQQPAYVIHIFPPCEFSQSNLARLAPDWLQSVPELAHLLIVIATV